MGILSDAERGPVKGEFERFARRDPLSPYLQPRAYIEADEAYLNTDDTIGYVWECTPLAFMGDDASGTLSALLRQAFPDETVLSFCLYPDPEIDPILDRYLSMKTGGPLGRKAAEKYAEHISAGRSGMGQMSGIRVKNFRVIVSIKSPTGLSKDLKAQIVESLASARMAPTPMKPPELLRFMRALLNDHVPANGSLYNPDCPINKQIVLADTKVRVDQTHKLLWLGDKPAGCLTPNVMGDLDPLEVNSLVGGFRGFVDDETHLNATYLWTTSVTFRTTKARVRKNSSIMMAQRAGGAIAKDLRRRVEELSWVLDDIEDKPYCDVLTSLWVFGDSEDHVVASLARARRRWENSGQFVMQRDDVLMLPLLLAALPMGVVTGGPEFKNLELLQRDFPMSIDGAARLLPVQADFAGRMSPALLLLGRKGQLVTLDLFDRRVDNHNFLAAGGSGSGKSFTLNVLVSNYRDLGSLIRIVDIGGSYKKQAIQRKGRYLELGDPSNKIVINPFVTLKSAGDLEDQAANRATIVQILLAMAFSGTGTSTVREEQYALMKAAVDYAMRKDSGERGLDLVHEFLSTYPDQAVHKLAQLRDMAHLMAFQLTDWISTGRYGPMFCGKSTLDISSDAFVVLELERLQNDRELFGVVSLQVLNAMTQDLYLSDRSQRRFLMFDEAWKYLIHSSADDKASGSGATSAIAAVIEEGYRRARKYSGATGVAFQSPLDIGKMGKVGEVITGNAAFKFWLKCPTEDWAKAVKRDVVPYTGLAYDLAVSVASQRPRYSEIFCETPVGSGVARVCVDRWTYWMNTSSGDDYKLFHEVMGRVGSAEAALDHLAAKG